MKTPFRLALAALALALTLPAAAQAQGDPARGRVLAYTCTGCHGIEGYKNAYPNYHVPRIGGQNHEYLLAALQGYKKGERAHPTMQAQAQSFSDQDLEDLAAFISGAGKATAGAAAVAGDAAAGKLKAQTCQACHGLDGNGVGQPMYPLLAGQHPDYIRRALGEYKAGARSNPIMAGFAGALSEQDIADLAAWFAAQPSKLDIVRMQATAASK